MAFQREATKQQVPTSIDHITVFLQTDAGGDEGIKGQFEILDQAGAVMKVIQIPLAEHLTTTQINQLRAFMATIRTRANNEILPGS